MSVFTDTLVMVTPGIAADELERMKARIAERYSASPGGDLAAMMAEMTASLERSPMLRDATARKTGGHTHLIEVQCHAAVSYLPQAAIMAEIERLWQDELRYDDFEAHTIELTDDCGILDFVTATRAQRFPLGGSDKRRFRRIEHTDVVE